MHKFYGFIIQDVYFNNRCHSIWKLRFQVGGGVSKFRLGNLDVTGRYFIWTANLDGDRLDAFLAKIPDNLRKSDFPREVGLPEDDSAEINRLKTIIALLEELIKLWQNMLTYYRG